MSHLTWLERPTALRPVLVAAFEGWNDAGDAATTALEHLIEQWGARRIATVDPEDFYDFTVTRPTVRIDDGGATRRIDWPTNDFWWAEPEGSNGVVLLRGVEPQLRWRTFGAQVHEVATTLGCTTVLTLGALLAEVAHTRPTPVFGNADDPSLIERFGLVPSRYEGPTGIVGVLHAELAGTSIDSASLWAAVPSYVPAAPSPKAARALAERATEVIGAEVPLLELGFAATAYEHEISQLVDEDDSTADYVRQLEEQHDRETTAVQSADDMVEEVERFLREQ